jgi:hypothetical protein
MFKTLAGSSKFCFLVCIVLIITCAACSQMKDSIKDIVYPPIRINGNAYLSLVKTHDLYSAFEESDLVAHIRVGSWLEEIDVQTSYDATVVTEYKGEGIKNIVLIQDGSSRATFKNYPLFTYGNEMILFLKKAKYTDYANAYYITGSYSTVLDVVADSSGIYYLVDRIGMLSEPLDNVTNYASDFQLRNSLKENLINADDIWSEIN